MVKMEEVLTLCGLVMSLKGSWLKQTQPFCALSLKSRKVTLILDLILDFRIRNYLMHKV